MNVKRTLARSIFSNWTGFAAQLVVTFVLTPFVLRELGATRYGVWVLVTSVTGYYGLLDLGVRAGLTQYMTRYLASSDYSHLNRAASSGFVALLTLSACVAVASLLVAALGPALFDFRDATKSEVVTCILVVGLSSSIQFIFFPFAAVFTATQRFDLANGIGIGTTVLTAILTWSSLDAGFGLVGIAFANAVGGIVDYLIRWRVSYKLLPRLRVRFSEATWADCRDCIRFGFWNMLVTGGVQLTAVSGLMVVGFLFPIGAATWYALAARFAQYYEALFQPIGWSIYPEVVRRDVSEPERLRDLYRTASQAVAVLALSGAAAPLLFADTFYSLWIGPLFVKAQEEGVSIAMLFRVLLAGAVCSAVQRTGWQVLTAIRQQRTLAVLMLSQGIMNILLGLLLGTIFGLLGVATAVFLGAVVFQGVIHPFLTARLIGLRPQRYHRVITLPLVLCLACLSSVAAVDLIPLPTNWSSLSVAGAAVTVFATTIVLALFAALTDFGTRVREVLVPRSQRV
jgi:O-antigen/teichoic acid export membrane protein